MGDYFFENSIRKPVEASYDIGDQLGRGGTSIVRKCTHKATRINYALKSIRKDATKSPRKILNTEVNILVTVDHPHIVKLKEIYETPEELHLVLELVTGGELFDRIIERGFFSEKDAAIVIRELLEALTYLHSLGIVHRDIKPENLLVKNPQEEDVKLADFGLSKISGKDVTMQTVCGTPGYVAPEVLLGKTYGKPVDMWAVGVICYILLCGFEPFYSDSGDAEMYSRILKCDYEFLSPYWDENSLNAKDLISKLLVLDPQKRMTAKDALKHPWVQGQAAKGDNMPKTLESLKEYVVTRRKLRGTVYAVMTCNFMKK
ncbi:calcium/calmodulin-dependent protein kinase type IV-like [Oscarella lobularis]|uniref:calcium/calmodulin-dependent protein kinase type IV-like n=1 Tax=Oscarella lobularis TaxID=121494 RepID=UPI0033141F3D